MVSEKNVLNSFKLVKNDIMKLQKELIEINQGQAEILDRLGKMDIIDVKLTQKVAKKPKTKTKIVTKTVRARPKTRFLASKEGDKFHNPHCPFAKNIKPKTKVVFKTKTSALNKGYKPCACVK